MSAGGNAGRAMRRAMRGLADYGAWRSEIESHESDSLSAEHRAVVEREMSFVDKEILKRVVVEGLIRGSRAMRGNEASGRMRRSCPKCVGQYGRSLQSSLQCRRGIHRASPLHICRAASVAIGGDESRRVESAGGEPGEERPAQFLILHHHP